MEYMSAREAADKWGISQRRVAVLCSENRIENATMIGNMWIIPTSAEKPIDARSTRYSKTDEKAVKPFLKWAGGKGQLIKEIERYYPFDSGRITKYAEPFVGGGVVLFDILSKYDLEEVYISDINAELINTYSIIRDDVDALTEMLYAMQSDFIPSDTDNRKVYYLKKRERFNDLKANGDENINIEKAALMIFLNKTCFNGLFRVNKKGLFNVPMGAYKNPMICDEKISEQYRISCRELPLYVEITENRLILLTKTPLFILIRHTDLLQIQRVLPHIQRICLIMTHRLSLHNLLMKWIKRAQKLLLKKRIHMIFSVTIEELISQDFKINANSIEEAVSIAKEKYDEGKFVLAPGTLIAKQIQVENEDSTETTEWTEF